jgi:hypothetical protein
MVRAMMKAALAGTMLAGLWTIPVLIPALAQSGASCNARLIADSIDAAFAAPGERTRPVGTFVEIRNTSDLPIDYTLSLADDGQRSSQGKMAPVHRRLEGHQTMRLQLGPIIVSGAGGPDAPPPPDISPDTETLCG